MAVVNLSADYLRYADRLAVGVVEAKKVGQTLTRVAGLQSGIPARCGRSRSCCRTPLP